MRNSVEEITPIAAQYGLEPQFVEKFGKVQRVYTNKGVFAVKKIPLTHGTDFIRQTQWLFQKGYNRIVPIYPTLDGRYAIMHKEHLYYLMPWLSNEYKEDWHERHQQMFRELARLHTLSVQEIVVSKEEKKEHYDNMLYEWENEIELLDGFLASCEEKWYMSPFELLFCLYYHEISQALSFSLRKLKDWYEESKDNDKARVVLSHGKVSPEHFIYDDRGYGYFTNFENSKRASPMYDLLPYLARTLKTYPKKGEECIEWLYTYFKFFPLREEEMNLFLSYFAHPSSLLQDIENYLRSPTKNERKHVQKIQRHYWQLKNIEYIVMRIDEVERQKKMEKEAQAQNENGAQE